MYYKEIMYLFGNLTFLTTENISNIFFGISYHCAAKLSTSLSKFGGRTKNVQGKQVKRRRSKTRGDYI